MKKKKTNKILRDCMGKVFINNEINQSKENSKINNNKNKNDKKDKKERTYNDKEINELKYEIAIKKDNRTYCQYYSSLLRLKHILIFTFCNPRDYNSQFIKIYIFFLTFAINYLVSAMFYSDDTMHKIYVDEGSFDFTYQLPQMFYSLLISSVLKTILNLFGLYENIILLYKNKRKKEIHEKEIMSKIKYRIIIFFIMTYILLFFLWYYLGCFCAVYKNTQIHLFIDVLSSFIISVIIPFFIYLLPGMFRIPSLKKKVNGPLMYKISKLLQLL